MMGDPVEGSQKYDFNLILYVTVYFLVVFFGHLMGGIGLETTGNIFLGKTTSKIESEKHSATIDLGALQ